MNNILLIDDDEKLGQLLEKYCQQFDLALQAVTSPSAGFKILESEQPDLLILDVMLPEMDGFEVCRRVRSQPEKFGKLPIVMLTARGDVTDRIVGLELGADDYVPKPFEPRELVARVQNVLRRTQENTNTTSDTVEKTTLLSDGLYININSRQATLDEQPLDLTTMEYELLKIFMQSNGRTYHRDELMNELRGIDAELYSRAIDTLVSRLRHKLNDTSKSPRFIKTIWGRGYAFIGVVQ